jgi:hypothetical protein
MDIFKQYELILKNLIYQDNMQLLVNVILGSGTMEEISNENKIIKCTKLLNIINKINLNIIVSNDEINIINNENNMIDIKDIKYYLKNINNEKKLINYFFRSYFNDT